MPNQIWSGLIESNTYRVIDLGTSFSPRLCVEILAGQDLMGQPRWQLFDPIPTAIFSRMLLDSGVVH